MCCLTEAGPAAAKKALAEKLGSVDMADVLTWLVEGSRAGGFHGLDGVSDETVKKVVEALMEKVGELKEIATKNFASE